LAPKILILLLADEYIHMLMLKKNSQTFDFGPAVLRKHPTALPDLAKPE
jgi:hypothetical protein